MLIFDSFPDVGAAKRFRKHVAGKFKRGAHVCLSQSELEALEDFPFEVRYPAVLVERESAGGGEAEIQASVGGFGGEFAGT